MSIYKRPYLQPYKGKSTRHTCPACKTKYAFTLYLYGNTGQPIHPTVGKCNREIKCGYHYTPRQYFDEHPECKNTQPGIPHPGFTKSKHRPILFPPNHLQTTSVEFDLIPKKLVEKSVSSNSNFVQFLRQHFNEEQINNAIRKYSLGATKNNEVIFWQIDINENVRTGKIMQYNPETGRRIKHKSGAINWVHNKLKKTDPTFTDFKLSQCYFGEHLLRLHPCKPVAIVEAEKTAVIASMLFDNYIWLAAGNLNGITAEKSTVLWDRNILLFPDAGCFEKWNTKKDEIRNELSCQLVISNLVETHATPQQSHDGYDIADYIIQ